MVAASSKTYHHQLDDLLVRLEVKADRLLNADQWDEEAIVLTAKLRFLFAEVIGKDEVSLANYLSNTWGYCGFTEERLANGYSFLADKWTDDEQPLGFYHDYLAHVFEGHLPICFKVGWMFPFMYSTRIFIHTQVRSCLISSITKHRSKTQRMSCRQCLLPWC